MSDFIDDSGYCSVHQEYHCECYRPTKPDKLKNIKMLVIALLQESQQKYLIDPLRDEYLNEDYHVELTVTVGELIKAAKELNIKDF